MATEINNPVLAPDHSCFKELNPNGPMGFFHMVEKSDKPKGLIARCSCGTLWILEHYSGNYNSWVKANWKLRWKHRNDGWEGVNNESY